MTKQRPTILWHMYLCDCGSRELIYSDGCFLCRKCKTIREKIEVGKEIKDSGEIESWNGIIIEKPTEVK